jgi:hypothetical protein
MEQYEDQNNKVFKLINENFENQKQDQITLFKLENAVDL